jgi:hypothetical protein
MRLMGFDIANKMRNLGNIVWNSKTKRVGFIDLEFFMEKLTVDLQPKGFPLEEYAIFIEDISNVANKCHLEDREIFQLVNSFSNGYKSTALGEELVVDEMMVKLKMLQSF